MSKQAADQQSRRPMVPGEIITGPGRITLNKGARLIPLEVSNTGDRPIQVGSHYHFYEVNSALRFPREIARGRRLAIPPGTAVRFEPGQTREVFLVDYPGARQVWGFNQLIQGPLDLEQGEGGQP